MKTHIYNTPEEVAEKVIERILSLLETNKEGKINIALSGGSTPATMFKIWAERYADKTDWSRISLFWVDERCVAPDSKDSNFGMTKALLLDKVNISKENVHRIMGENNPEDEAIRYSSLVSNNIPSVEGMPCFDLVLLGAGDDGHTSSIFPTQEHLLTTNEVYAVSEHPVNKIKRIALTGKPIQCAKSVLFVINGDTKSEVVKSMLADKNSGPAAYLAHTSANVELFLDMKAASKINK